jgi:hypothetical protein
MIVKLVSVRSECNAEFQGRVYISKLALAISV